ncbi:diiron oxygenase [Streptomyces sp. APSN-46.1]|uniref:diiron oxygenase n=1 Tax=Streptomyces sp. APSN-46.1 TaxID=2929049 RepID=UPI001FB1FF3F|nr:diiron oxygenase [Streptomyces sp. APSN-46.1]MCJ1680424.1 diiron oxygenase [Streptomyces sp. APSN-46.1]
MAKTIKPLNLELDRLEAMAESDYYNPYTIFEWPDTLEEDRPWMSEDLVTLAGTEHWDALTREQQLALTRFEAVNFFSLNIHGIRELLSEVVLRIHTKTYADASEFLHHFIGEENEHMWFFGAFCLRYGKKVYPAGPAVGVNRIEGVGEAASELVIFARILIFEEIVDYFNAKMATDQDLPHIAREINRVHHQDESRHVAFGRYIFTQLLEQVKENHPEDIPVLAKYLDAYLDYSIRSLYNPAVYRDAGLENPLELRRQLLEHPARKLAHNRILNRTQKFLERSGLGVQGAEA